MDIKTAFEKADRLKSNLPANIVAGLRGMSSPRIWHLLNNLVAGPYLEIGVWKGSTLTAALYGKNLQATAIDDFSQFGGPRKEFLENIKDLHFRFVDGDCFNPSVIFDVPDGIKYYFYDGGHTEQNQYNALALYIGKMAKEFVYIVDDWNVESVQKGTARAVEDLGLTLLGFHERRTPKNGHKETWWNGIAVLKLRK